MTFKLPTLTDNMLKEMEHEPTRYYAECISRVVEEYGYTDALEIGCAWGVSTLAILTAQDEGSLTSVDVNPKNHALKEVDVNGLNERWSFVNSRSEEFWKENTQKYDLIYVDGSHLYEDVKNDLFQAWDALKDYGLLMIDDATHKQNRAIEDNNSIYGVAVACWELVFDKKIARLGTEGQILYMKKGEL